MPATIIGNSEWTLRGLVLTAQDAQEQVNGLVNVQVTYVGPASRHDQISREFYQDAPPPIWPSVVSPSELVTNRLYMESRSVSRANGLTTVQANYVSGLQRSGFSGYFLRETTESPRGGFAGNYVGQSGVGGIVDPSASFRPTGGLTLFIYEQRIKQVQFVQIGNVALVSLPVFFRQDMVSILRNAYSSNNVEGLDLWVASFEPTDAYLAGLNSYEKDTPARFTESAEYVTPTVKLITRTYRFGV
jgi:hypothetical protein